MDIREALKYRFEQNANEENAVAMKAYMKGRFDLYGIKTPVRKSLYKDLMSETKKWSYLEIESMLVWCWDQDQRDYQYFGLDLLQRHQKKLPAESLEILKFLISSKSWWDTVDLLASNPLGTICRKYESASTEMDNWIKSDDMWLRRSAIIYQLKSKDKVDEERLFRYCDLCKHESEFFIRKAIGWALRQHSRVAPEKILTYVAKNEDSLSGLSKREALRLIK